MIAHSQLAPLPSELPFEIVSKTIGQGAYACIKKAQIPGNPQVFAVKFIHKKYAIRHGRLSQKQLDMEITLHKYLGAHQNIVEFFQSGEDSSWRWIAMELAEGGDLFDKIESDVGVGEDIAQLYFMQLISAMSYMHSKGVGHRDIKPENMLLSLEGSLKIADFGLATLFEHHGQRKTCKTSCGSPPYTAPEVLCCTAETAKQGLGYYGDLVDIWSCGVVLFVLLVGNTPWDEPTERSVEFHEYAHSTGRPLGDELWANLPDETISLLRGMMSVNSKSRFSLSDIQAHPWFKRANPHINSEGCLTNPVGLATEMFESMHIDFSQDPLAASQRSNSSFRIPSSDPMDVDAPTTKPQLRHQTVIDSQDLQTPTAEIAFDWDTRLPASQHSIGGSDINGGGHEQHQFPLTQNSQALPSSLEDRLGDDPFLSQFAPQPVVPVSRTQFARRFADILPAHSLTRFVSPWAVRALLPLLTAALWKLNIPVAGPGGTEGNTVDGVDGLLSATQQRRLGGGGEPGAYSIRIRTRDDRKCTLSGEVVIESLGDYEDGGGCQVCFVKVKGDPVQWRRLFKRVVLLCQEAVWKPEGSQSLN